jgi:hypothetical chaperone protein
MKRAMSPPVAGLDFGTSNSAIGLATSAGVQLHTFAHEAQAVPTALFWDDEDTLLACGQEAEARFLDGHEGRYLRALKSILGTNLADESTRLGRRSWTFRALLERFVGHLKTEVERAAGAPVTQLVAGRPVRFDDDDDQRDAEAERTLRAVLEASGFRDVRFVLEPVAALIDSERDLRDPGFILVADIGGGTSDFTLAARGADGGFEVLANHGVHVGGTDLDRSLSLGAVMPHLGHGTRMRTLTGKAILPVPAGYYVDLATWQKIPFLYTPALRREVQGVVRLALEPEKVGRLLAVLDRQLGHRLATAVEQVKIALSSHAVAELPFHDLADLPPVAVSQDELRDYFSQSLNRIAAAARETLGRAGIDGARIGHLVLTGGSTLLPDVRQAITGCVPQARLVETDPFVAVARGLTRAAQRAYL